MNTGKEILASYQQQRDPSGSALDEYISDLLTFHCHARLEGKEGAFYSLLEEAELKGKQIGYKEMPDGILIDEYTFEDMILIERTFTISK